MPTNDRQPSPLESRLRIGAVQYLNTAPLVHGLAELAPRARLSFDLPSRLADQLAAGELDIALAPSIEAARHPEWSIVSTACIAASGPVLSVKLYFRGEPAKARRLALDEGSRTSAALAQILLADRFGGSPELTILPIGADAAEADADAVLVIGDRAIRSQPPEFHTAWDLGEEWVAWTKLPFVFAVWAARPGAPAWEIEGALDAARDRGCHEVELIAAERAAAMDLPPDVVLRYLRNHLSFRLGQRERRGLELFCRRAVALGLAPAASPMVLDECGAEG